MILIIEVRERPTAAAVSAESATQAVRGVSTDC